MEFVVVFDETGLRTRAMPWVDCCLVAGKMAAAEIKPATRAVLDAFDSGPVFLQEMIVKAAKESRPHRRRVLAPVWN